MATFVAQMNNKARELGMRDTRFVEPTGLSSKNQSSAQDLAKLVSSELVKWARVVKESGAKAD